MTTSANRYATRATTPRRSASGLTAACPRRRCGATAVSSLGLATLLLALVPGCGTSPVTTGPVMLGAVDVSDALGGRPAGPLSRDETERANAATPAPSSVDGNPAPSASVRPDDAPSGSRCLAAASAAFLGAGTGRPPRPPREAVETDTRDVGRISFLDYLPPISTVRADVGPRRSVVVARALSRTGSGIGLGRLSPERRPRSAAGSQYSRDGPRSVLPAVRGDWAETFVSVSAFVFLFAVLGVPSFFALATTPPRPSGTPRRVRRRPEPPAWLGGIREMFANAAPY